MSREVIFSDRVEVWERDFNNYLQLIGERKFYTETDNIEEMKRVYKKIYIYTTVSNKVESLKTKTNLKYFYNECRNNLIISFDLMNFNYITSSKQIIRSSIESFFRLTLSLEQLVYYSERIRNQIYSVDDTLRALKSLQESHKVGKLTSYTVNYFNSKSVRSIYERLNEIYSVLSSSVHVNKAEHFTPHKYLSDYNQYEQEAFDNCLSILEEVSELIIQALYYFSYLLEDKGFYFEKRDIISFEVSLKYKNYLEVIDESF
ncbi:hypothetical protein K7T73_03530 [Bacillus badius]|uniref:hypothetical protein n=1 Tax=Bacillus badius TaxID=1455 RepID=UPI001CBF6BAC|nr:hypothetical protein [Bacillus badius]UAT31318.1 hypothetical protein K7T73_03530 [Bacillus badius]